MYIRKRCFIKISRFPLLLQGYSAWNASVSLQRFLDSFQKRIKQCILATLYYVSALQSLDMLPTIFQFIKISHTSVANPTQSNKHASLNVILPTNDLLSSPQHVSYSKCQQIGKSNFCVRSKRAANEFFRRNIIHFDNLQNTIHRFQMSSISNFNSTVSCRYFIKCYCTLCR